MNQCHIEFEALLDYYEGRADARKTGVVRRHLASGCAECQGRLTWLGVFLPALHRAITAEMPLVPPSVMERARNIARERQQKALPPLLVRIARLIFDSRQAQPAFGARSAENSDMQLVYSTDSHDVDLWQERQNADVWYLIGQVLPKDGGEPVMPNQVVIAAPNGRSLTAVTAASEFTASDVPSGTYEIRLRLEDQEIVLPDVIIGTTRP